MDRKNQVCYMRENLFSLQDPCSRTVVNLLLNFPASFNSNFIFCFYFIHELLESQEPAVVLATRLIQRRELT